MSNKIFEINGRLIGSGKKPYIIAEMSGNHNGDLERAIQILEAAKNIGADAIKLQTYTPDTMTIDCNNSDFNIVGGPWDGYTLYDLYKYAHTPWDWHDVLIKKAKELDITIFSSPFDKSSVDFLEDLNMPAYKIASFELTDLPLIEYIASTGKPIIISTGMGNLLEIKEAVEVAQSGKTKDIAVLHCVSGYPTPISDSNLLTMNHLANELNVISGLSDHTLDINVAISATSLGAAIIEKHITLNRDDGGPDAQFSLEPDEFKVMIDSCHKVWSSLGKVSYDLKNSEKENLIFRRSLYVVENIKKGEAFTEKNIRSIRPGYGVLPKYLPEILKSYASKDLKRGTALDFSMISKD